MTREEAKEFFEDPHVNYQTNGYYTEEEEIEANNWAISALSADVSPNIHGHWEKTPKAVMGEGYMWYCNKCLHEVYQDSSRNYPDEKYCSNCGADMREPKGEKGTE